MRDRLLVLAIMLAWPFGAFAGPIDRACISSNRETANRELCACIQRVANVTLTGSDQKIAAKIFRDPTMAQKMRHSDQTKHKKFWRRYTEFGAAAELVCSN